MKCKAVDKSYFLNHPVLKNHISLLDRVKSNFLPDDDIIFVKAPGRVNLIGEHTDYNMGPVLPCAIDKEIVFCVRPNTKSTITAININEKFTDVEFSFKHNIEPFDKGHWGNYIKAGVKGIVDYTKSASPEILAQLRGYDIVASGTLPLAAGLSSSSALVVASALSFVIVNNLNLDKQKIAAICAKAEHFVGTAGGGMDQAASLLGKENSFLKMEFNPLRIEQISAPEGIQLVLFHSLVEAEKSGKARFEYNRRVLECRMAVDLFNHYLQNMKKNAFPQVNYIGEVKPEHFNLDETELDQVVQKFLHQLPDAHTTKEFASAISLTIDQLADRYQSILRDDRFMAPPDGFKVKSRFKHVYTECRRVHKTVECLRNNKLDDLGMLINESHNSLSQDYEVSLPEVDELVNILRQNGAYGARIMGAGFGGMVLAYTDASKMDQLIEQTQRAYYNGRTSTDQKDYILPCVAADGAGVLKIIRN